MIFKCNRTAMLHIFKMEEDLGYKNIGTFRGAIQWHMMESKDLFKN